MLYYILNAGAFDKSSVSWPTDSLNTVLVLYSCTPESDSNSSQDNVPIHSP